MIAFILSNVMKFAVPMALFVWSIFQPAIASYVFVSLVAIFVGYLFFDDIANRPKPDPGVWTPAEATVIRNYHLALRFPLGARDFSCYLNGIRLSSFIWVPWMLWNHLWIPASFLVINFVITLSIAVRLDPFFFLSDAVCRGQMQFAEELAILQTVQEKLNERARSQQPPPTYPEGRADAPSGSAES
jgi:hypothetical protein